MSKESPAITMYRKELLHHYAFAAFATMAKEKGLRELLEKLADVEKGHANFWLAQANGKKSQVLKNPKRGLAKLMAIRQIMGLEFTMKIMERDEKLYERLVSQQGLKIKEPNEGLEDALKSKIMGRNKILDNIRDIFFGMSDGLVEILAAVAGIGAALQQPLIVLIAGSIVALSGTLSMAGGAYLSTDYENIIRESKNENYKPKSPLKSAAYVGISYVVGSAFPLMPFIFGMSGLGAIAVSIILTAIVLAVVSTILSILSETPIKRRVTKTLVITIGIAMITMTLGLITHYYLHVSI